MGNFFKRSPIYFSNRHSPYLSIKCVELNPILNSTKVGIFSTFEHYTSSQIGTRSTFMYFVPHSILVEILEQCGFLNRIPATHEPLNQQYGRNRRRNSSIYEYGQKGESRCGSSRFILDNKSKVSAVVWRSKDKTEARRAREIGRY